MEKMKKQMLTIISAVLCMQVGSNCFAAGGGNPELVALLQQALVSQGQRMTSRQEELSLPQDSATEFQQFQQFQRFQQQNQQGPSRTEDVSWVAQLVEEHIINKGKQVGRKKLADFAKLLRSSGGLTAIALVATWLPVGYVAKDCNAFPKLTISLGLSCADWVMTESVRNSLPAITFVLTGEVAVRFFRAFISNHPILAPVSIGVGTIVFGKYFVTKAVNLQEWYKTNYTNPVLSTETLEVTTTTVTGVREIHAAGGASSSR